MAEPICSFCKEDDERRLVVSLLIELPHPEMHLCDDCHLEEDDFNLECHAFICEECAKDVLKALKQSIKNEGR